VCFGDAVRFVTGLSTDCVLRRRRCAARSSYLGRQGGASCRRLPLSAPCGEALPGEFIPALLEGARGPSFPMVAIRTMTSAPFSTGCPAR